MSRYKDTTPLEQRRAEREILLKEHPSNSPMVAVICEQSEHTPAPPLPDCKFLVPAECTVSHFLRALRERLAIPVEGCLFVFCRGRFPAADTTFATLADESAEEDGFVYLRYCGDA
eukprot:TRINITY_DN9662_c0_g1_i1.p1 TRINITY_DN9662_c0_g1~~TRINITY_DN9662_c0_g1_i1.p1  ORF type:complete len:116 (+),score=24.66 TRINITY_DN9662_c0_g1_i1:66-413(+)